MSTAVARSISTSSRRRGLHELDGGRYIGTDDLVIMRDPEAWRTDRLCARWLHDFLDLLAVVEADHRRLRQFQCLIYANTA